MNPDDDNESLEPADRDENAPPKVGAAVPGRRTAEDPARQGGTDVQSYIGRQLRAVYDDVLNQPIPDRFLALMKQLEDQTPKS